MGSDDIRSAVELLGSIPAAALHGDELICSNGAFDDIEKKLGRDKLYEVIKTGGPTVFGKHVYYADLSDKDGYVIAVITKRLIAEDSLNSAKIMHDISHTIRSSVTAVSSALDDIYNKGKAYSCIPPTVISDFESANRVLSSLYGKILMYDDLELYETESDIYTVSADLHKFFRDSIRDMRKIINNHHIRLSLYGDEDSYAVIRPDTLRILFAASVREILLMDYKPEYVDVHVFHNDTETGFTVTGGTFEGKRSSVKPPASCKSGLIPQSELIGALTDSFCEKLGGRYYMVRDDLMYHMGMTFPRSAEPPKTGRENAVKYKNNIYSGTCTFSYERSILADAVKSGKYSEDDG